MTNETKYYAVVKLKKAELISPSESQLMSYYIDYGYTTISDVIEDYGESEMLREWYNNTNLNIEYKYNSNIFPIDWDSEFEEVDVIDKADWDTIYESTYV
jgi:hypothetical protein